MRRTGWIDVNGEHTRVTAPFHRITRRLSFIAFHRKGIASAPCPQCQRLVPRNDARACGLHMAPAEGGRGFALRRIVIASDGQAMRGCAKQSPRDTVRNDEAHGWIDVNGE